MLEYFYDTCALLEGEHLKYPNYFYVSDVTLSELENIKTNINKSDDLKFKARKVIRYLIENPDKYRCIHYEPQWYKKYRKTHEETNDIKIMLCALYVKNNINKWVVFLTRDCSCKVIAHNLGLEASYPYEPTKEQYHGYKEVDLGDSGLAFFYENLHINHFLLNINEYVILKQENKIIDIYKWDGENNVPLMNPNIKSIQFGDLKPKDVYQRAALDSFVSNPITLISGPAGSGKTYLALNYLFWCLEKHKIDRIVIFCNPVVARNAAKLGSI